MKTNINGGVGICMWWLFSWVLFVEFERRCLVALINCTAIHEICGNGFLVYPLECGWKVGVFVELEGSELWCWFGFINSLCC